jgi:hypothetical protein
MPLIENNIIVNSSKEAIWPFITDEENFNKYIDDYIEGEFLTENKTGVGSTFRWYTKFWGRRFESTESVIVWKENERVEYEGDMAGAWFHSQMILTSKDEGTEFKVSIEYKMPYSILGKFLDLIYFRRRVRKDVIKSIQNVKNHFEKTT